MFLIFDKYKIVSKLKKNKLIIIESFYSSIIARNSSLTNNCL